MRDVGAIRAAEPSIADIGYYQPFDGRGLFITVTRPTSTRMQAGQYHDWDCLNRALVVTDMQFNDSFGSYVILTLKGIYNLRTLATQYQSLDGVMSAGPNEGGGDGSTICVTQQGATWHYVFDRAGGDCPAGCTEHSFLHFSTDADGTLTPLGVPNETDRAKYASTEACR